jgi:hypothetical protein
VDFRNPEAFYHDVNSVAGLLKQFFRDLPEPLLTREHYQGFIEAARKSLNLPLYFVCACDLTEFIGIDDDVTRRDSLHAIINSLPDPNYATLRALTLVCNVNDVSCLRTLILQQHLNRVQEHSNVNRMNAGNLAICFGCVSLALHFLRVFGSAANSTLSPTLMGSNTGPNIADAGWQVRVIDTILQNTYQIFDDD